MLNRALAVVSLGYLFFHSPLCIEVASAQIATHLMLWVLQGLIWIHRIKTLNRVGLQVSVHIWLESLSNLPKQLSRQLRDIHGWSSLATSQSVTVIFFFSFHSYMIMTGLLLSVFIKYMFSKPA